MLPAIRSVPPGTCYESFFQYRVQPSRRTRKYGIDAFGHYRMKVRNPDTILKATVLPLFSSWPVLGNFLAAGVSAQDPSKLAMPGFGRCGLRQAAEQSGPVNNLD